MESRTANMRHFVLAIQERCWAGTKSSCLLCNHERLRATCVHKAGMFSTFGWYQMDTNGERPSSTINWEECHKAQRAGKTKSFVAFVHADNQLCWCGVNKSCADCLCNPKWAEPILFITLKSLDVTCKSHLIEGWTFLCWIIVLWPPEDLQSWIQYINPRRPNILSALDWRFENNFQWNLQSSSIHLDLQVTSKVTSISISLYFLKYNIPATGFAIKRVLFREIFRNELFMCGLGEPPSGREPCFSSANCKDGCCKSETGSVAQSLNCWESWARDG